MTATTAQGFTATHRAPLAWSVVGHCLIVVALSYSLVILPRQPIPQLAIEAVIVDESMLRQASIPDPRIAEEAAEQRRLEAEQTAARVQQERRAAEERAAQAAQERQAAEQRAVEERRVQAEQAAQRKQAEEQAAEQRKQEAAERVAEQQKQAAAEKARREQAARDAAEKVRRDAERLEQQRREAELTAALNAEEALAAAAQSGELNRYIALIQQKVQRKWNAPAGAVAGLECEVAVTQLPDGTVLDARTERCNGDDRIRRSVEAAVMRASPLPLPDNRALFERNLRFVFKPEQ